MLSPTRLRSKALRESRITSALAALVFAACASQTGGAEITVKPPLGEGNWLTHDVGVNSPKAGFQPILAAGCELPCKGSFVARTSIDDQKRLQIRLVRRSPERRTLVTGAAAFQITEIPPGPAGGRAIEVTVRAKKNRLTVSAVDQETGKSFPLRTLLLMEE